MRSKLLVSCLATLPMTVALAACGGNSPEAGTVERTTDGLHTNTCSSSAPSGVLREEFLVDIVSPLPQHRGQNVPAVLDVKRVRPVYAPGCEGNGTAAQDSRGNKVAIVVHGRTIDSATGFDLQVADYSLMEQMARAGIDTFSLNFLGFGKSSHFELDDPCNANDADRAKLAASLTASCTASRPYPYNFSTTEDEWAQLDATLAFVKAKSGVKKVSMFAWSMGGPSVASWATQHPDDITNMVLQTPAYTQYIPLNPPAQVPSSGFPLGIATRGNFEGGWNAMANNSICPGERDTALLNPLWTSVLAADPLGASWETSTGAVGVQRFANKDRWGWAPPIPSTTTIPTLLISGERDLLVTTAQVKQMYDDLGSEKKVLIQIACASHFLQWEGSTAPSGWGGPHATLRDATIEWIRGETFQGASNGFFKVSGSGDVTAQ